MRKNPTSNKLYTNAVNVDEITGLPQDYNSFFAAYWPLMLSTAERLNIPIQDRADAAQEVQIKFWLKNGLDMFDPERKTKFATLLRRWASMFMMQERDKVTKSHRYIPVDASEPTRENSLFTGPQSTSLEYDYIHQEFVSTWLSDAQETLERMGRAHLVPVLHVCVRAAAEAKAPTRAQIAEVAGVKIGKATSLLKELREFLDDAGMGIESLYSGS